MTTKTTTNPTSDAEWKVCPFTVVIDTREQAPYGFHKIPPRAADEQKKIVVPTERGTLRTGDYSVKGLEDRVAVERKSLEDLYGTLGQWRERFKQEFERLNEMEFAAVVIEASPQELIRPREFRANWHSRLNPRSVWGTWFAWSQKYSRVHWFTMGSRRLSEIATFEILERFWGHATKET